MTEEEICAPIKARAIKQEVESTLKNFDWNLDTGRKCGNTTRQVDLAIQILFNDKICVCRDHYQGGECRSANIHLCHKVIDRLRFEFGGQQFNVDNYRLTITLTK